MSVLKFPQTNSSDKLLQEKNIIVLNEMQMQVTKSSSQLLGQKENNSIEGSSSVALPISDYLICNTING